MGRFVVEYSTLAPTRAPLDLVEDLHDTPRFGGSRGFDVDEEYWYFSLDLAFAIGIIFAALLAFYMAWVFGRKCCWNCQRSVERFERGCVGERTASAQRLLLVAWILGSIAAFAALTAAAQGPLHRTAATIGDALGDLESSFATIDGLSDDLVDVAGAASYLAGKVVCPSAPDVAGELRAAAAAFVDEAGDVKGRTDGVAGSAGDAEEAVRTRRYLVDAALLASVALVALALPPAAYGACFSSAWVIDKVAARYAFFVVALLGGLVAVEYGGLVKLADFCVAPDANAVALLDRRLDVDADAAALAEYYVSCGGANPLVAPLNASLRDVYDLNATVAAALGSGLCAPAAALRGIQRACGDALGVVAAFQDAASCDELNPIYHDVVHDTACRDLVEGAHVMATGHVVAAALLYLWLYVANYVSETLFLLEELTDLGCEVLATPRHKEAHGARNLEAELRRV